MQNGAHGKLVVETESDIFFPHHNIMPDHLTAEAHSAYMKKVEASLKVDTIAPS